MSEDRSRDALPPPSAWWGSTGTRPQTRSIVELLRDRVLDAELAALLWLLLEARLPVVVTGSIGVGRSTLLTALLDFLPADARPIALAGIGEEFEWLPEATELGWRRERSSGSAGAPGSPGATATGAAAVKERASAGNTVLLVADLGAPPPAGTGGPRARIVIRALALGYGMAATMTGERLEDVLGTLRAAPVSADDDELSRLGIVLAVNALTGGGPGGELRRRVVAAHYVRPVVRDAHGHVQRMPPAVLAAYEPRTDRLEHFAWGIIGDLAGRTGLRPIEFEREQARRASYLSGLVTAGITDRDAARAAITGYRGAEDNRPA